MSDPNDCNSACILHPNHSNGSELQVKLIEDLATIKTQQIANGEKIDSLVISQKEDSKEIKASIREVRTELALKATRAEVELVKVGFERKLDDVKEDIERLSRDNSESKGAKTASKGFSILTIAIITMLAQLAGPIIEFIKLLGKTHT